MVILKVAGYVDPETVAEIKRRFADAYPELKGMGLLTLLTRRNPEEVHIGHRFRFGLDKRRERVFALDYELVFVTQQYLKPFPSIPAGWHTISLFRVLQDSAIFRDTLPLAHDWYDNTQNLYISDLPPLTTPQLFEQIS
ncbi:hypothetical protein [Hymenobacter negativus]|uniref:Uncharacterized protein n=1 Tax=Hymenobacter negativus TaxID=2795026 RepID=A0ABS3QAZ6_9BACT|nr:hypothetical protein [Hymenobacter negativus]MBO2007885.1 hypothetical protein [Hymenobacter negativus]